MYNSDRRPINFGWWHKWEPDNRFGQEDCAVMTLQPYIRRHSWNDINCYKKKLSMCVLRNETEPEPMGESDFEINVEQTKLTLQTNNKQ